MDTEPDEMTDDRSGLPQPGTDEPSPEEGAERGGEETAGPGNVTVDEPTDPALAPEEIEQESTD